MRVLIDDQIFSMHSHGGISRYFVELMQVFQSAAPTAVELVQPRMWTKNQHLLQAGMGRELPTRLGRRRLAIQAANYFRARSSGVDIVHHTYYNGRYLSRYPSGARRVTTVYDMIPELLPHFFPAGNPHLDKQAFVRAADLILCISESTKRDLLTVYGDLRVPVVVTPLGVDSRFQPGSRKPGGLPSRYLLFVGSRGGYKDFQVLAEAFAEANLPRDVHLVAVGGGPLTRGEARLLGALGITERVLQIEATDRELPGVYSHALLFVFPSRYEGFGLPTLEAMASGCPTILARSSAHPEVGGDAAHYFSPEDAHELAGLLSSVVSNPQLRADLRAAGLLRAESFTWLSTAQKTLAAYEQVRAPA